MMNLFPAGFATLTVTLAALLGASPAWGQLRSMSEGELSETRGQGLIDLTNSSFTNVDNTTLYTTRIGLGADIKLSANFTNLSLGNYARGGAVGTLTAPADIDIPVLQFGRSDAGDAKRLVSITNPYFEFVYRNIGTAATREVVGMRFGFEGVSGDIGILVKTLSGSVRLEQAPVLGAVPSPLPPIDQTGVRVIIPQIGTITAGNDTGPSRDYWISVLKTPVQFQAPAGVASFPAAQAGFWLNWRDKLVATLGTPPPNLPLTLSR
jgi:hypothetical protein